MPANNEDRKPRGKKKIIQKAKARFKRCMEWEQDSTERYIEDRKFAVGDPDNGWQWPDAISRSRNADERPMLTVNKTRQHNLQIINEFKKNRPGIKIRPTGDGATYESAQIFEGVVRYIEYRSKSKTLYGNAVRSQVEGGIGYWRVITDYIDQDSFDQDIFLKPIKDTTSVYIDPDILEQDGSDMKFAFIFDDVPFEKFKVEYPNKKELISRA